MTLHSLGKIALLAGALQLGAAPGCSFRAFTRQDKIRPTGDRTMEQTLLLTVADEGSSREAKVGQPVTLRLEENPTTGYRWSLSAEPASAVEMLDSPYTPGGTAPGAGGMREFHLRTLAPANVHLHLKLWREWQGEGSAVERREFVLQVTP